jgi:hypothetical protein
MILAMQDGNWLPNSEQCSDTDCKADESKITSLRVGDESCAAEATRQTDGRFPYQKLSIKINALNKD